MNQVNKSQSKYQKKTISSKYEQNLVIKQMILPTKLQTVNMLVAAYRSTSNNKLNELKCNKILSENLKPYFRSLH